MAVLLGELVLEGVVVGAVVLSVDAVDDEWACECAWAELFAPFLDSAELFEWLGDPCRCLALLRLLILLVLSLVCACRVWGSMLSIAAGTLRLAQMRLDAEQALTGLPKGRFRTPLTTRYCVTLV